MSVETNRRVLSADHNAVRLNQLQADAGAECHHFEHIVADDEALDDGENLWLVGKGLKWSVAFIDQKTGTTKIMS